MDVPFRRGRYCYWRQKRRAEEKEADYLTLAYPSSSLLSLLAYFTLDCKPVDIFNRSRKLKRQRNPLTELEKGQKGWIEFNKWIDR